MIEPQTLVTEPPMPTTVVSLTDAAATKLRELTKDETNPDIGLRVYVYSGGCSGFRYGMMLEDAPTPEDNVLSVERHQGLRRRPEHRPPAGLADRLRRHAHGRRLHGQQPERRRGLWLRLELPHRRRRGRAARAARTDPRSAAPPEAAGRPAASSFPGVASHARCGTVGSWAARVAIAAHADAIRTRCLIIAVPGIASRSGWRSSPPGRSRSSSTPSLETGSLTQSFVYDAIGASAVVVALIGIRIDAARPARCRGCSWPSARPCSWPATWPGTGTSCMGEDPFPSIADVAVPRRLSRSSPSACSCSSGAALAGGDRGGLLDAAILTAAVAHPVVDLPHPAAGRRRRTSTR